MNPSACKIKELPASKKSRKNIGPFKKALQTAGITTAGDIGNAGQGKMVPQNSPEQNRIKYLESNSSGRNELKRMYYNREKKRAKGGRIKVRWFYDPLYDRLKWKAYLYGLTILSGNKRTKNLKQAGIAFQ
ncbi:hypothetical protein KAW38_00475 [Candidatus Micrarchaeota archaeon]|nr:hypothetical protein [Candidatus Micrarchaeota archaeon]